MAFADNGGMFEAPVCNEGQSKQIIIIIIQTN